jgi:hypothetical protein
MTDRFAAAPYSGSEPYSPQLRTALVLTGTGTAGAYHAGAVRALHEAGIKVDLAAGRGIGAVGALFLAMDGASRLWDDKGFWRSPAVRGLYRWRAAPRIAVLAVAAAVAVVAVPVAAVALGLVVFPLDFLSKMIGLGGARGLVGWYLAAAESAFAPGALPTWLPRIVLLVLAVAAAIAFADGWRQYRGRTRGGWWWRGLRAPLSSSEAVAHTWRTLWDLVRGAAQLKQPPPAELARRYIEMVTENLGQPGFRELLIAVHDVDARRDLVFALVAESRRRSLVRRATSAAAEARRAEVFDMAGADRALLADAIAASLSVPLATDLHDTAFAAESYWRGETHRLCDRPASLIRLIDELIELGVRQIVLITGTPDPAGPHTMALPRFDGRGRLGEYLDSSEAAIVHDATTTTGGVRIYTIRPVHNPIGPFDFDGGYDDRSHRSLSLPELMARGYEDAYHQFIEPIVGASGDRLTEQV